MLRNILYKVLIGILFIMVWFSWPYAKAQTTNPPEAVINVSGVPAGTKGLAVEVVVDTSIVTLSSAATSNVSGSLVVTGSMSEGVGIISTASDLPTSFSITVPFVAVAEGTSMVEVGQVLDMIGGTQIGGAIASVDIDSVNVPSFIGTFSIIGPKSIVGPGKVAVAFSVEGAPPGISATLNGSPVDFVDDKVGIGIVDIPTAEEINLNLAVTSGGETTTIGIGSIGVSIGHGTPPKINSAVVQNKPTKSRLVLTGKKLQKNDTTISIVPTDPEPASGPTVMGAVLKATFDVSECIPDGSYINVATLAGTSAKKIKVRGKCSNPLLE